MSYIPILNKFACLTIALLVSGTAIPVAYADQAHEPGAEASIGLVDDLLALGGSLPFKLPDGSSYDTLLQPTQGIQLALPSAMHAQAVDLQERLEAAERSQDVLIATFEAKGVVVERLQPTALPASLDIELLRMYALLGIEITPAEAVELRHGMIDLTADQESALATMVDSVNRALVMQQAQTDAGHLQAALLLLDTADEMAPMLQSQSAASAACNVYEDPQHLVYYGSLCDDTVGADGLARIIEIDPAGDDTYLSNAGGADTTGLVAAGGVLEFGATNDRSILEVTSNMSLNFTPITPIPVPPSMNYTANQTGNFTNSSAAIIDRQSENMTNQIMFLQEFVNGWDIVLGANESEVRRGVPLAIHVDFAGNDHYASSEVNHQGSTAAGGIGIALDWGGDDVYEGANQCQGFSTAGIGLLADMGGADSYSAAKNAQGAGDGGFLLNFGDDDDVYEAEAGAQGSKVSTLIPNAVPSMLFDHGGDDMYTSGDNSQGANNYLVDLAGNDAYTAGGYSQGAAYAQSEGLLLDAAGDDHYSASFAAQGAGSFNGVAVLLDRSGDDTYTVTQTGQGTAVSAQSIGLLIDEAGNDAYTAGYKSQGFAFGGSLGALLDRSGDDVYTSGDYSQGSADDLVAGGFLGILVDGAGDDQYTAGDVSQGAGEFLGAGMLFDAGGREKYTAGSSSQGSGAGFGIGVLIDGAGDAAMEAAGSNDFTRGSDEYVAGAYSQGSSGSGGGVGILMDRHDPNGRPGHFVAGNFSQGSARLDGIGILNNANGKDRYVAGTYSQGSSLGGVGLILDEEGNDWYEADLATSHGFGNSTLDETYAALGLFMDIAGNDRHTGLDNNACRSGGGLGLAIDVDGVSVPPGCDYELLDLTSAAVAEAAEGATRVLNSLTAITDDVLAAAEGAVSGGPAPVFNETVYFQDDMENGTTGWTTSADGALGTDWRWIDQATEPRAAGPNAHSGTHYWYVGTPVAGGYTSDADATLTSPAVNLTSASNPELRVWLGGSSEADFDFLTVSVINETSGMRTQLDRISGGPLVAPGYAEFTGNLTAFAGHSIRIEFRFTSDEILEPGQGWNVDDLTVKEA